MVLLSTSLILQVFLKELLLTLSAEDSWEGQLEKEIEGAAWIFLLFDSKKSSTMSSIENKWLPKIRSVRGTNMVLIFFTIG